MLHQTPCPENSIGSLLRALKSTERAKTPRVALGLIRRGAESCQPGSAEGCSQLCLEKIGVKHEGFHERHAMDGYHIVVVVKQG